MTKKIKQQRMLFNVSLSLCGWEVETYHCTEFYLSKLGEKFVRKSSL